MLSDLLSKVPKDYNPLSHEIRYTNPNLPEKCNLLTDEEYAKFKDIMVNYIGSEEKYESRILFNPDVKYIHAYNGLAYIETTYGDDTTVDLNDGNVYISL